MNWYDRLNFNAITTEQWQEISDRMNALGYDWRGWEDAKNLITKRPQILDEDDHKKVFNAVVKGQEYAKEKMDTKDIKNIFNKAIRYFGITNNLKEAGYILPNGTLLDLSGKSRGGPGNRRDIDHSEIGHIINMKDFVQLGAIRHFPEQPGVDIKVRPTPQQLAIIRDEVDNSGSGYTLELFSWKKPRFYNQYDAGTRGSKIVNDINNYYSKQAFNLRQYKMAEAYLERMGKEAGWKENLIFTALFLVLSGFSVSTASKRTNVPEEDIRKAMERKEMVEKARRIYDEKVKGPTPSSLNFDLSSKDINPSNIDQIVNVIIEHEGLIPGQTPFRYTSKEMRGWNNIHGFKIDKTSPKPSNRQNFIFLKDHEDVPKAVKTQLMKYIQNPSKYNLKPNPTIKEIIEKFDQTGAQSKIKYLLSRIPNIDINAPFSRYI